MPRRPRMHWRLFVLLAAIIAGQLACSYPNTATPAAAPSPSASPVGLLSSSPVPTGGATDEPMPSAIPTTPAMSPTPAGPDQVSRIEVVSQTGGEIGCVATQGHYAYLAIGPRLAVLDMADPARPRLVGETVPGTARITDLVVVGDYACLGDAAGRVHIVAIADPAHPRRVGSYTTVSPVHDLALADGYLYLAADAGLYVIDVRDPAQPAQAAFYDTPGQALQLLVSGGLAFVSVGAYSGYLFRELRILDVHDPAQPKELAVYERQKAVESWATMAVGLQGHYAYVTAGGGELRVLDVADPAHPVQVASYPTGGPAQVLGSGDARLTLAVDGNAQVFDTSDPARPRQVGRGKLPCKGELVAAGGDLAYTVERQPDGYAVGSGAYASVLHVVNTIGAQGPAEVGQFAAVSPLGWSLDTQATRMVVASSRLYVAADRAGLRVLDVADAVHTRLLGGGGIPGFFYDVVVTSADAATGRVYALVADGSLAAAAPPGLRVFDVTDPAKVAQVGFYDSPGNAMGVAAAGHYAYLADGQRGLRVVDLTDPARPVEVGAYERPGFARSVAVVGQYAYVADSEADLRIVDVADPAHPREVAVLDSGSHATAVTLAGEYAYVTTATGVRIVRVADAAHPAVVGEIPLMGAGQVAMNGTRWLSVASGEDLRAYDVADPAQPKEVARLDLRGAGTVQALATAGAHVYVATNLGGVWVLSLQVPQ